MKVKVKHKLPCNVQKKHFEQSKKNKLLLKFQFNFTHFVLAFINYCAKEITSMHTFRDK